MKIATQGDEGTPLKLEEIKDLIPNLSTQEELNEWERENILEAREWAVTPKNLRSIDPFTEEFVRKLHQRMFGQTWRWAGKYRKTERNLGKPVHQIIESIGNLIGDAQFWLKEKTYSLDEIAVRFHHRLVLIHPFANGNGRHARLLADIIAVKFGQEVFSWGSGDIIHRGEIRKNYIKFLQSADKENIAPLLKFART